MPLHDPALPRQRIVVQRTVFDDVRRSLATAFGAAWALPADSPHCSLAAAAVLASVDGLALHAVSAGSDLNGTRLVAALDLVLTAVLTQPTLRPRHHAGAGTTARSAGTPAG